MNFHSKDFPIFYLFLFHVQKKMCLRPRVDYEDDDDTYINKIYKLMEKETSSLKIKPIFCNTESMFNNDCILLNEET